MQARRLSGGDRVRGRRGFTLIELLAVISIIVVLIGLIMAGAGYASRAADRNRCRSEMQKISTALDEYMAQHGTYIQADTEVPMKESTFGVLSSYMKELVLSPNAALGGNYYQDPWGNPFYYSRPNKRSFTLRSFGPDGRSSNDVDRIDDLSNQRSN